MYPVFLRGIKAASNGVITEIFVMDNKGLNVGQTNGTGDYMQGDEAKWKETYLLSAHAVFIDEVEEEDGINIAQTSLTVARDNGFSLGAVTIGINVDALYKESYRRGRRMRPRLLGGGGSRAADQPERRNIRLTGPNLRENQNNSGQ